MDLQLPGPGRRTWSITLDIEPEQGEALERIELIVHMQSGEPLAYPKRKGEDAPTCELDPSGALLVHTGSWSGPVWIGPTAWTRVERFRDEEEPTGPTVW